MAMAGVGEGLAVSGHAGLMQPSLDLRAHVRRRLLRLGRDSFALPVRADVGLKLWAVNLSRQMRPGS
jgi:hypothetical protein